MFRILFTAIAVMTSVCLLAQNPTISIQGTLKDVNGASVSDGDQNITFKIYDALTGGTVIWQETADVRVTGGIYSHQLGSVDPINGGMFSGPRWLGIVVEGLELSPRSPMSYAPYAMSVNSAQQIAERGCSGQVGDLKYSYLNPTQFAQVNGDCWVPMDGRAISGSRLAQIAGIGNVPDASGTFLRAHEFAGKADRDDDRSPSTPVASFQPNSIQRHNHSMNAAGNHSHNYGDAWLYDMETRDTGVDRRNPDPISRPGDNGSSWSQWFKYEDDEDDSIDFRIRTTVHGTQAAGNHTHTINESGSHETRPENFNFYLYIRIN